MMHMFVKLNGKCQIYANNNFIVGEPSIHRSVDFCNRNGLKCLQVCERG